MRLKSQILKTSIFNVFLLGFSFLVSTSCQSLKNAKTAKHFTPEFGPSDHEEAPISGNTAATPHITPLPPTPRKLEATPTTPSRLPETAETTIPPTGKKKTLIIGDSLSAGGGYFGPGLAKHLSEGDQRACLHSVSGARFEDFLGASFTNSKYGASFRNFHNGNGIGKEDIPKKTILSQNWSLQNILKNRPCGDSTQVDELVVQLGSNHAPGEDPVPHIKSILTIANTSGIKSVKFILPPGNKSDPKKYAAFNAKAISHLRGKAGVSYFDSTSEVSLNDADSKYADDDEHFWRTPSESNWLAKVQSWLRETPQNNSRPSVNEAHRLATN